MEKLARGIMPEKIDAKRLKQYREFSDRKTKEFLSRDTSKDVWPSNQYAVNCDLYCDRHRACGPIYRSKK